MRDSIRFNNPSTFHTLMCSENEGQYLLTLYDDKSNAELYSWPKGITPPAVVTTAEEEEIQKALNAFGDLELFHLFIDWKEAEEESKEINSRLEKDREYRKWVRDIFSSGGVDVLFPVTDTVKSRNRVWDPLIFFLMLAIIYQRVRPYLLGVLGVLIGLLSLIVYLLYRR